MPLVLSAGDDLPNALPQSRKGGALRGLAGAHALLCTRLEDGVLPAGSEVDARLLRPWPRAAVDGLAVPSARMSAAGTASRGSRGCPTPSRSPAWPPCRCSGGSCSRRDGGRSALAFVIFGVASLTDWFDGWLARRYGSFSRFGRLADPLADRLLIDSAVILLWHHGRLPLARAGADPRARPGARARHRQRRPPRLRALGDLPRQDGDVGADGGPRDDAPGAEQRELAGRCCSGPGWRFRWPRASSTSSACGPARAVLNLNPRWKVRKTARLLCVEAFPDLVALSDADLKALTEEKMADERDVSRRAPRAARSYRPAARRAHAAPQGASGSGRGRPRRDLRRAARADARGARGAGRRRAAADRRRAGRRRAALGRRAARADPRTHPERARGLLQAAHAPRAHRPAARRDHRAPARPRRGGIRAPRRERRRAALGDPRAPRPAARAARPSSSDSTDARMYCPECGMQNPEAAHYCARCGGLLAERGRIDADDDVVRARARDRDGDARGRRRPGRAARRSSCAPAIARASTSCSATRASRSAAPRAPTSCSTTSRSRASTRASCARPDGFYIEDADSLNGTYVNRRRVESHHLTDGDELQIGKFKLTYLER